MQWVGVVPESGEVLMLFNRCLTEQTRYVVRSRWVWWRTWALIIICKTDTICQQVNLGMVAYLGAV